MNSLFELRSNVYPEGNVRVTLVVIHPFCIQSDEFYPILLGKFTEDNAFTVVNSYLKEFESWGYMSDYTEANQHLVNLVEQLKEK